MDNNAMSKEQETKLLRKQASTALARGETEKAHRLLALAKSLRAPVESLDYLRGLTFLKQGDPASAREALKEELRYFPGNSPAQRLLQEISRDFSPALNEGNDEFKTWCSQVLPFTMVTVPRLHSLYQHAIQVCTEGPAGTFVECGVAGGGSSGLLSAVLKKYAPNRRLFSCDSFCGMPPATEEDIRHDGQDAMETGWGEGTCAAPENSLLDLCGRLGTQDIVTPVKGFFEDTLPARAQEFGSIAFLHMDGDWYSSTKTILENLYDRLAPQAYVQVDDFGHWNGCRKALVEFFQARGIKLEATRIDASGIWFRKQI